MNSLPVTTSEKMDHPMLNGLTAAQIEAVTTIDGPVLVLAGPGSGKTTVVTRRIAWLVEQGVPAWQILALTFTNKAAREMRDRVDRLVPEDTPGRRGLTVSTFHAFCARLLRRYAQYVNLPAQYSIYNSADQRDAIKQALVIVGLDTRNWTPYSLASSISNAKNRLLNAAAYAAEADDFYSRSIAKIYSAYEKILKNNDALDFDDLLLRVAVLLRDSEEVRRELQDRYVYLLIDEYQDTNHAQFVIAHTLANRDAEKAQANICVVGDPDQSIYGWRGADIGNILEFEDQYPQAKIVPLGQNFRSTAHIVAAAAGLIANNSRRKAKELFTELPEGEKPTVTVCTDEHSEATLVVDEMMRRHDEDNIAYKDMAVLYRINALSRVLEEEFRHRHVPYVIARGTAFYERKEIKDALSYLRMVANPNDEVSMRRIINTPTRGIGSTTIKKIELHSINRQMRFVEALRQVNEISGLSARAINSVGKFVNMLDAWGREAASGVSKNENSGIALAELVGNVIHDSGLEALYRSSKNEEDQQRLDNLQELVSAAAEYIAPVENETDEDEESPSQTVLELLSAFLETVTLVSDADAIDPANGAVTLLTLHAAKGLEFDVVAMVGLEEGLLPHSRAATSELELEEERRLCYVGMTRAKRHLLLIQAASRTIRGMRQRTIQSQFISELPEDSITISDQASLDYDLDSEFGNSGGGGWGRSSYDARYGDLRTPSNDLPAGCVVRHPQFGLGRVQSVTPRPAGSSARVEFETVGIKTLILEYAKLERVE